MPVSSANCTLFFMNPESTACHLVCLASFVCCSGWLILVIRWERGKIKSQIKLKKKKKRKNTTQTVFFMNNIFLGYKMRFPDCDRDIRGKPIRTEHWEVLISCKSHFLWTSYLMFWHRYPCKCSARCLWILKALFCTWIVRVVGDHLILGRRWLTHAFISGYAPLWCQPGESESERERGRERPEEEAWGKMEWERDEGEEEEEKGRERGKREGKTKRMKHKETDRKPGRDGRVKSLITVYYWCVAMCRRRVFINTVDTKHSLIQRHKEHFALADIYQHCS